MHLSSGTLLRPSGLLHLCEGNSQHFSCSPDSGMSLWYIYGLKGIANQSGLTTGLLNSAVLNFRLGSEDGNIFANPSHLTVLNVSLTDDGANISCQSAESREFSQAAILNVAS